MQVLLVAVIRDSLLKKSKSHTHVVRSPRPICPSFPRPTQRKDWKEPKLRKCRNASTFFLLTPSLFPFLFLFPIPNLHQYLSAYIHMPTNSLILKREHFRRWTTMFFYIQIFYCSEVPYYPSDHTNANAKTKPSPNHQLSLPYSAFIITGGPDLTSISMNSRGYHRSIGICFGADRRQPWSEGRRGWG